MLDKLTRNVKIKRPDKSSSLLPGLPQHRTWLEARVLAESQRTLDFDAPPTGRKTILAHKIALDPTVKQRIYFARAAGASRFVYNWALAEWKQQYKAGGKPNGNSLKIAFNAIKY